MNRAEKIESFGFFKAGFVSFSFFQMSNPDFFPRLEWGGEERLIDTVSRHFAQIRPTGEDQRLLESVLFTEALTRGDARAVTIVMNRRNGTWACKTCGCSDEFGLDGEVICGCDSCTKGCESVRDRLSRGAKRSATYIDACDVLRIVLERCKQDYHSWADGSRDESRFEILEVLDMPFPKAFEPTISRIRTLIYTMGPLEEAEIFRICIVLIESLLVFSELGERVYMFEEVLSSHKRFLERLVD